VDLGAEWVRVAVARVCVTTHVVVVVVVVVVVDGRLD
jgi:hypothetical protein